MDIVFFVLTFLPLYCIKEQISSWKDKDEDLCDTSAAVTINYRYPNIFLCFTYFIRKFKI